MAERQSRWGKAGSKRLSSDTGEEPFAGCHPSGRGRSRIAVVPFAAGGSEKSENLAFALAHEIAVALGRCRRFEVIAGMALNSDAAKCLVSEHQFRRMKLDYLIDLTVAANGHATEISLRLLDLNGDARAVWSKRLNSTNCGAHQIGELAATHIINRIDPAIPAIWDSLDPRKHYGATGFLRRAVPLMFSTEREKFQQAGQLIKSALEIEPDNGEIATLAARWQHFNVTLGYTQHSLREQIKVRDLALRAMRSNRDNAEALGMYAHCCAFFERKFDAALHHFDRSLRINSSLAFIWGLSSLTYCYIGEPRTALECLDHCRELAPFDPYRSTFQVPYAIAYLFNENYERAASVGRRAVAVLPEFVNGYKPLIAALGHLGRHEEAKPYIDKLLNLEPNFTVETFAENYPIRKAADRRRYMEGLHLAGVAAR